MATVGRKRKSVAELKLSGLYGKRSSHKEYNDENPNPIPFAPAPKRYLQRTKVAWNQFMRVKCSQGILSEEDSFLVKMMFDDLDHMHRQEDRLVALEKKQTDEIDVELEEAIARVTNLRDKFEKSVTKLAIAFGITPPERSKLILPKKENDSEFMKILERAKA